jgi:preprotein translocase SecE subunit
MAISASKKKNLVDTEIIDNSKKKDDLKSQTPNQPIKEPNNQKPKGFLASTIGELKKVEWPKFNYILRWSVTILIFTAIFAVILGGFDRTFEAGIKFVDCSSSKSRNQSVQDCSKEFLDQISL